MHSFAAKRTIEVEVNIINRFSNTYRILSRFKIRFSSQQNSKIPDGKLLKIPGSSDIYF